MPAAFEQRAILWIEQSGFARREAEEGGVEPLEVTRVGKPSRRPDDGNAAG